MGKRNDTFYDHLKDHLKQSGIGIFLFDRRGSGDSTGDFETASFNDLAMDALAAVTMLKGRQEVKQVSLYGISQGAWVASLTASYSDRINSLILVSASGVSPADQMLFAASSSLKREGFTENTIDKALHLKRMTDEYFRSNAEKNDVERMLQLESNSVWYPHAFLPANGLLPANKKSAKWYYQLDFNPLQALANIHVPILFLYGDSDIYVPIQESINKFKLATRHNDNVEFITVTNADHFMEDTQNKETIKSQQYIHVLTRRIASLLKESST